MNSVHINGWNDLKQFGINPLTGEACRLSMRTLCDLSQKGVELLSVFLGIQPTGFNDNWNSKVGEDASVASIMLSRGIFDDLCKFAIFTRSNCKYAIKSVDGSWHGYSAEFVQTLGCTEEELFSRLSGEWHRNYLAPAEGSRNVHQFTGRTD